MAPAEKAAAGQPAPQPRAIYDQDEKPVDGGVRRLVRLMRAAFALVWRSSPRQVVLMTVLQALGGIGVAAQLLIGSRVVAAVLRAERQDLGLASVVPSLALLVAVTTAVTFASTIRSEMQRLLGESANRHAVGRVADVATAVDLEAYERAGFHDRLMRAQNAAMGRPLNLVMGVTGVTGSIVGVVGLVVALLALAPLLVPIVVLGFIPLWYASVRNSQSAYRLGWRMTPSDRLRYYLMSILTFKPYAEEVRAFGLAPYVRDRYERLYDERMAYLTELTRTRMRRSLWAALAGSALSAVTYGVLVALLLADRVSAAAALPTAIGIQQLGARLNGIASSANLIYESSLFLDDFDSFVELVPEVVASRPTGTAPAGFGRLTVDHVSFRYPETERLALDDVSLELEAGQVVALVGANGSGKTTLAKLLCHLYRPTSGRILWDGTDTAGCDPNALRASIAVIFQDFVHYSLTARENVTVGDYERADQEVAVTDAAHLAGADGVLTALPEGYDTMLGRQFEGGSELSIGQWQRVALARAFFRDAPFLILDEPTAALDARAEHDLFERIREMADGRTVLLISHRFSSVRSADRILVLENGRVIEEGDHEALLSAGGRYAELFTLQAEAYLSTPT